ncbi:hypothetical protein HK100_002706, partial [Physocladia obscura]
MNSTLTAQFSEFVSSIGASITVLAETSPTNTTALRLRKLAELRNAFNALTQTLGATNVSADSCSDLDSAHSDTVLSAKSLSNLQSASPPAPPHFGDIMSMRETLIRLPDEFSPLERILLTANGNVQRILRPSTPLSSTTATTMSSVENIANFSKNDVVAEYDRHVELLHGPNNNRLACSATSTVTLGNSEYLRLIDEEHIGIGQLFRYLNILPNFELLSVGRDEATFWRVYTLSSGLDIQCVLKEVFPTD